MKFQELNKEQRAATARAVADYLKTNNYDTLQQACETLGQTPQAVWDQVMDGAGLPRTDLPERIEITVDETVREKIKELREKESP